MRQGARSIASSSDRLGLVAQTPWFKDSPATAPGEAWAGHRSCLLSVRPGEIPQRAIGAPGRRAVVWGAWSSAAPADRVWRMSRHCQIDPGAGRCRCLAAAGSRGPPWRQRGGRRSDRRGCGLPPLAAAAQPSTSAQGQEPTATVCAQCCMHGASGVTRRGFPPTSPSAVPLPASYAGVGAQRGSLPAAVTEATAAPSQTQAIHFKCPAPGGLQRGRRQGGVQRVRGQGRPPIQDGSTRPSRMAAPGERACTRLGTRSR